MATVIHLADSRPNFPPEYLGRYTAGMSLKGAAAAVVVDTRHVRTSAQLSAALAAAAQQLAATLAYPHAGNIKDRSESTQRTVGPFDGAAFDNPKSTMFMVPCRSGQNATQAAAQMTQGPNIGPCSVAILVDLEAPGAAAAAQSSIAAAMTALLPLLDS